MTEQILDADLNNSSSESMEEKYLEVYFDQQYDWYIERYRDFQTGRIFTFNIGSFLAGLFWFMYRKLYIQMAIIVASLIAFEFVEDVIRQLLMIDPLKQALIDLGINLVWWIAFGFCGNYLYFKQVERKVARVLASTTDEDERLRLLRKKGGTSNSPFYLLGLIIVALAIVWF